jgi:hypothetical protein
MSILIKQKATKWSIFWFTNAGYGVAIAFLYKLKIIEPEKKNIKNIFIILLIAKGVFPNTFFVVIYVRIYSPFHIT